MLDPTPSVRGTTPLTKDNLKLYVPDQRDSVHRRVRITNWLQTVERFRNPNDGTFTPDGPIFTMRDTHVTKPMFEVEDGVGGYIS